MRDWTQYALPKPETDKYCRTCKNIKCKLGWFYAEDGVKVNFEGNLQVVFKIVPHCGRNIPELKKYFSREYFRNKLSIFLKKHPKYIEPQDPYYSVQSPLPSDYPPYNPIKFPSGNYNFYNFDIDLIQENCDKQIKTIKEQVKYLEECKVKWEYFKGNRKLGMVLWQDVPEREVADDGSVIERDVKTRELVYKHLQENFIAGLARYIKYKKSLLSLEEKYNIPNAEIMALCKTVNGREKAIEPFQWLQSERQFAWLIDQLADQGYIDPKNKWINAVNHFVNREGKKFRADSLNSKAAESRDLPEKNLSIPLQKVHDVIKNIPTDKE
jgi:hypothetical protein